MNSVFCYITTGTSLILYGAQEIYSNYQNEKKYKASLERLKNIEVFEEAIRSKLASLSETSEAYRNFKLSSDETLKRAARSKAAIQIYNEVNKPNPHKKTLNIVLFFGGAIILAIGIHLAAKLAADLTIQNVWKEKDNSKLKDRIKLFKEINTRRDAEIQTLEKNIFFWEHEKAYDSCLANHCQCSPLPILDEADQICVNRKADITTQRLPHIVLLNDCKDRLTSEEHRSIMNTSWFIGHVEEISNQFQQLRSELSLSSPCMWENQNWLKTILKNYNNTAINFKVQL